MESERTMKVSVQVDVNTKKILDRRGLGGDYRAQKFLASEVARFCDPYVPMQQGFLKNQYQISSTGDSLTYVAPYAHYQYYGQVMAGRAPKHYTGDKLTYNGAPMRGAQWEKRMLADKSQDLTNSLEAYIKQQGG